MNNQTLGGGRYVSSAAGNQQRLRSEATLLSGRGDIGRVESSRSLSGRQTRDVISTLASLAVLLLLAFLLGVVTKAMPEQHAGITRPASTNSTVAVA